MFVSNNKFVRSVREDIVLDIVVFNKTSASEKNIGMIVKNILNSLVKILFLNNTRELEHRYSAQFDELKQFTPYTSVVAAWMKAGLTARDIQILKHAVSPQTSPTKADNQVRKLTLEIANLRAYYSQTLNEKNSTLMRLQNELASVKNQLKVTEKAQKDLLAQLDFNNMQNNVPNHLDQISQSEKIANLQTQLYQVTQSKTKLESQFNELHAQYVLEKHVKDEMVSKFEAELARVKATYSQELNIEKGFSQQLLKDINQLQSQHNFHKNAHENLEKELNRLYAEIKLKQTALEEAEAKISEQAALLEASFDRANNRESMIVASLQSQIQELNEVIFECKEKMYASEEKNKELAAQIQDLQKTLECVLEANDAPNSEYQAILAEALKLAQESAKQLSEMVKSEQTAQLLLKQVHTKDFKKVMSELKKNALVNAESTAQKRANNELFAFSAHEDKFKDTLNEIVSSYDFENSKNTLLENVNEREELAAQKRANNELFAFSAHENKFKDTLNEIVSSYDFENSKNTLLENVNEREELAAQKRASESEAALNELKGKFNITIDKLDDVISRIQFKKHQLNVEEHQRNFAKTLEQITLQKDKTATPFEKVDPATLSLDEIFDQSSLIKDSTMQQIESLEQKIKTKIAQLAEEAEFKKLKAQYKEDVTKYKNEMDQLTEEEFNTFMAPVPRRSMFRAAADYALGIFESIGQ